MSVTAEQLKKSGIRQSDLNVVVREQLQIIDQKLLNHERSWGRNVITVNLPLDFPATGLQKSSAQRVIYSAIITSLQGRGFEVFLRLEPSATTLYVEWTAEIDEVELSRMNTTIKNSRIHPEEVGPFLDRGVKPGRKKRAQVPSEPKPS